MKITEVPYALSSTHEKIDISFAVAPASHNATDPVAPSCQFTPNQFVELNSSVKGRSCVELNTAIGFGG